jgi:hypothetical protein
MRNRTRAILIAVGVALLVGVPLLIESNGSIMAPILALTCCGGVPWLMSGLAVLLVAGAAVVLGAVLWEKRGTGPAVSGLSHVPAGWKAVAPAQDR